MSSAEPTQEVDVVVRELAQVLRRDGEEAMLGLVERLLNQMSRHIMLSEQRIQELTRRLYGKKTEHVDPNQLRLALEAERKKQADEAMQAQAADPDAPVSTPPRVEVERSKREEKRGRRALPAHLPRRVHRLVPTAEQMASLGDSPSLVGVEASEVLEWMPGGFFVRRYERETWSGKSGEVSIVTAPVPAKLVDKGLVGPGLAAHVAVSKVRELMPLARLSRSFEERDGVHLHRNTLVDVFGVVAWWLGPLAKLILTKAMASYVVNVDDTKLPVQDHQRVGTCKTGHLWVIVGDHRWVAYAYTENWTNESTAALLGSRIGYLQGDGFRGYDQFDRPQSLIILVGCWMHGRRGFVGAFELGDLRAAVPVELIAQLYVVEDLAKVAGDTPEQRLERRQRDSLPILEKLREWREEHEASVDPRSTLGKAITYLTNQWDELMVPFTDGHLEIDNGVAERELKNPAIGRKNWYFAGSDEGGARAAIINTVVATAVRQGVQPWLYVKDVLEKLMNGWPKGRIEELLPCRWAELHREAAEMALAQERVALGRGPAP